MPLESMQLGNYRLTRQIGGGGMGEVYLAEDIRITDRKVAIKVVRSELTPFTNQNAINDAIRLFQREMKAITRLDHPHILALYDFGEVSITGTTLTYMVMPFRPEGSLLDWLQRRGNSNPLSLEETADIVAQAADALQHAHTHGLIHQDIKPSNFLVRRRDNSSRFDLLLADFGVAKFATATATVSQNIRGTPAYMAPEHWDGQPVFATDQYALAVMAYQLLAFQLPFQGGPGQIMRQHLLSQPQPPSMLRPGIPPALDVVILRALAKKPEDRFPSISDFAQAFQQAIRHQSQQTGSDIRTTLTISREEALNGTTRTLNLPGGRKVSVSVPAGIIDGQPICLAGEGDAPLNGGPRGSLILTIAVASQNTGSATLLPGNNEETVRGHSGIQSKSSVTAETPPKDTDPSRRGSGPTSVPTTEPPITPVQSTAPPTPTVSAFPSTDPKAGELPPTIPVKPPPPPPDAAKSSADHAEVTPPPPPPPGKPKPDRGRLLLVALAATILIASIIGFGAYQNQVNQTNARATAYANDATAMASDATSTAVVIANATGTAQNPYPSYLSGSGTLALYDPLSSSSYWSSSSDSSFGGACQFSNGALHITQAPPSKRYTCDASSTSFSNFAFEVQMNIIAGDCGGIGFRNDGSNGKVYFFEVCPDGSYTLRRYTDNTHQTPLTNNSSSAISTGPNQSNTIAVLASGSTIELYVNQQKIASVNDTSYSEGSIGLIASAYSNQTEVAYTNARVWAL